MTDYPDSFVCEAPANGWKRQKAAVFFILFFYYNTHKPTILKPKLTKTLGKMSSRTSVGQHDISVELHYLCVKSPIKGFSCVVIETHKNTNHTQILSSLLCSSCDPPHISDMLHSFTAEFQLFFATGFSLSLEGEQISGLLMMMSHIITLIFF